MPKLKKGRGAKVQLAEWIWSRLAQRALLADLRRARKRFRDDQVLLGETEAQIRTQLNVLRGST